MLAARGSVLDIDSLYHFRLAQLIRERGPWVDISWLPFTVLGERGTDHQWLFHLLIAPLTALGSDLQALHIASAVMAAAMPAAIYPFLRRAGVPFALVFVIAMMFSGDLLPERFLALRAQDIAVVFMVATLFSIVWRKTVWIGVVAFLFTQAYHGAVILAMLLAATLAARLLRERTASLRPFTAVAIGVFAGLVASPWFPRNVDYLIFHTLFKATSGDPFLIGQEWFRPPLGLLVTTTLVAHGLLASGIAAVLVTRERGRWPALGEDSLASFMLSLVFLAMTAFSWRFVEYYGPFAVMTAGLLWRDALRQGAPRRAPRIALASLLAVALAWGIVKGALLVRDMSHKRFEAFSEMLGHIEANDPKPVVFNTRWSDFQQMVFWARSSRFVAGLDGHYLAYGDPKRFQLWYSIASGASDGRRDNARRIREAFDAGWVVVYFGQPKLAESLAMDPGARFVMGTPEGWLFRLEPRP
jgi:hypothetical protein